MKELIFALLAGGIGLLLLTAGYRLARIIIPVWAFFAGFAIGAAAFADATSVEFVANTMGLVVGLVTGLVFAIMSYFFYSLAVVLLGGTVGYWIGTGFLSWLGIDKGFLSASVGISVGVVFALVTLSLDIAKYLLIALTSLAGSIAVVSGLLVLLNKIEISAFDYTSASAQISESTLWSLVAIVLFSIGFALQYSTNKKFKIDDWTTSYGGPKEGKSYKQ